MDNAYDRAKEGTGSFERLLASIPGFRGYLDRETRREADKIEREFVAARLAQNKEVLRNLVGTLTGAGNLEPLQSIDRLDKTLETLINKIKFANYGYSGFFDALKVGERELNRVYNFDLDLIDKAASLATVFGELAGLAGDPKALEPKLAALVTTLGETDRKFSERDRLLRGLA